MTEENIDQIIRCIKECWWRVGILLAILLGFTLIAIHGWPRALGEVVLSASADVATILALAYAYRQFNELKKDQKKKLQKELGEEAIERWKEIYLLVSFFQKIHTKIEGWSKEEVQTYTQELNNELSGLLIQVRFDAAIEICEKTQSIIIEISRLAGRASSYWDLERFRCAYNEAESKIKVAEVVVMAMTSEASVSLPGLGSIKRLQEKVSEPTKLSPPQPLT